MATLAATRNTARSSIGPDGWQAEFPGSLCVIDLDIGVAESRNKSENEELKVRWPINEEYI